MNTSSSSARSMESNGDGQAPDSGGEGSKKRKPDRRGAPADAPMPSDESVIAYAKIFPGIGIARVGNSPEQFILGPEVPGRPVDADGRFKDREGRVKRQAARFRIYGFDAEGNVLKELTAAEADITWSVHLANKKGAWNVFDSAAGEAQAQAGGTPLALRNASVTDRDSLMIDPGIRSIRGAGQRGVLFDTGHFQGVRVELGELRTDEAGRLLVLGGKGRAESSDKSSDSPEITDFANNDTWFDDTSDGPVTAGVVLKTGQQVPVRASSWVVVGPPDYAPAVDAIVTLYDIQVAVARGAGWLAAPPRPSFTHDVYPILSRAVGMRWVNKAARRGHGHGAAGNLLDPETLPRLAGNGAAEKPVRQRVFQRLRNPGLTGAAAVAQANFNFMPQLSGDDGLATVGLPGTWFSLLPHQYEVMRRWAEGDFDADWAGVPAVVDSLAQLPLAEQPHALDRATAEACVGGPFFPGIEMTYTSRDATWYVEPHRLRPDLEPGDVTKRMAVPWQADFYDCRTRWWPSQRPDAVISQVEYESVLAALAAKQDADHPQEPITDLSLNIEPWDRGIGLDPNADPTTIGYRDMAAAWSELGILRPRRLPDGGTVLVEGERRPYYGMKDREYFHYMVNIESYPDFVPKARELAENFLSVARDFQRAEDCPDDLRPFTYSPQVLRSRLEQIYTADAHSADSTDLAAVGWTREILLEYIVQKAPFNQLDGVWLRNVSKMGPMDEVHAQLFHVYMDEVGDGEAELNHANIYTDLLHSIGVYLDPITSRAYIENERIIDSAFTSPLFQMVIGQFPELYLPELLGMTLFLEWSVVSLKPMVKLADAMEVDSTFFSLHVGIDNAMTGHGAMAKRAVELYLDEVRASSGDQAMQDTWRRIWDGYVAFFRNSEVGQDFRRLVGKRPSPADKVAAMMERKAHFGSQNHGNKRLGANFINNWFEDPKGFMEQLVHSGYILPGDVENSPFFALLKITGPMFRVFTPDEVRLWENWTRSLADPEIPSEPETEVGKLMVLLVDTLRSRQEGTAGHRTRQLTGKTAGGTVTKPVSWWFEQPTAVFLETLADPLNGWIAPGDPANSAFINELASGDHPMARVFGEVAPGTAHKTWRSIAFDWIAANCPLPPQRGAAPMAARRPVEGASSEVPRPNGARTEGGIADPLAAPNAPVTAATAAMSMDAREEPRIPRLSLFQKETWLPEYAHIRVYGNGALH